MNIALPAWNVEVELFAEISRHCNLDARRAAIDCKKKAAEEQAKKDIESNAAKKAMQELKSNEPSMTLIQLTPEQFHAAMHPIDNPINEAWVDQVSEKYGDWRPAKPQEKGIPYEVEFKKAG